MTFDTKTLSQELVEAYRCGVVDMRADVIAMLKAELAGLEDFPDAGQQRMLLKHLIKRLDK